MRIAREVALYNQGSIENGIDDASKVATSFITFVSLAEGIKVHNADDLSDYIQVNSNAISMYRGNTEKMKLTDSSLRLGDTSNNAYIDTDGMKVYQDGNKVAEFGSSARIGSTSDFNLNISSGGFSFKEGQAERVGISAEADSTRVLASVFSSGDASMDALVYSNDLSGTDHNASILLGAGGTTGTPYISVAPIADVRLSRDSISATAFLEANYDNTNHAYIRVDASSSSQSITIKGDTNVTGDLTVYGEPVTMRKVSKRSVSSLPTTISSSSITASMECIHSVLSNPSAQTGDWTVTTSAGSAVISGSISGTTDITLYLAVPR